MGNITPDEFPELDDNKMYIAVLQQYTGCGGTCTNYVEDVRCCHWGSDIKDFVTLGGECGFLTGLCDPRPDRCEKLKSAIGPYDDRAACEAAL